MSWVEKNPPQEVRDCCESLTTENHRDDCPIVQSVAESFKKDPERWVESYTKQNSESVRNRVTAWLALNNGNK